MSATNDYVEQHFDRFADQLKELLSIPSISTLSAHHGDVQRAADWIAADLRAVGFLRVEVIPTRWHPVVYAEHLGAGPDAPTVLVYSHYDVQPAEMADGWDSPPFEPMEKDGKIYARGAIDSKSNVMAQVKAAEALLATGGCPCNIKLLFEGDEETSSDAMAWFVAEYREKLCADVIAICDGSMSDRQHPDMAYGLRGVVSMELEVRGPRQDVHSGHYGGTVHNPIQALAEIIAHMHLPDGSVAVPGFYDEVLPLSEDERTLMARALPWIEAEWKAVAGAPRPWGEERFNLHERIGARPTLEINGIKGGFAEEGFKTVLPARALAKISCRLVPEQRSVRIYEQLRDFVAQITPPTVTAELRLLETGEAIVLDRHSPAVAAAEAAIEQVWGKQPFFVREGGSIPVVVELQRHLDGQIVMLSFGYKGCAAHGPNEHVYLDMWRKGIAVMIQFYQQVSSRIRP